MKHNVTRRHWILAAVTAVAIIAVPGGQPVTAGEDEGCLECAAGWPADCPTDYHKAANGNPERERGLGSHPDTCFLGTCSEQHKICQSEDLMSEVETALATGNADRIAQFTSAHSQVTFNAARGAVQVRDCNGGIVASVPLPAALAMAVSAAANAH
jgi:hypothetical protein